MNEIENAIAGGRGAGVMPQIEYRKMKALEQIADQLTRIGPQLNTILQELARNPDGLLPKHRRKSEDAA